VQTQPHRKMVQVSAFERVSAALSEDSETWWWGRGLLLPRCVRELFYNEGDENTGDNEFAGDEKMRRAKTVHQIFCTSQDLVVCLGHGQPLRRCELWKNSQFGAAKSSVMTGGEQQQQQMMEMKRKTWIDQFMASSAPIPIEYPQIPITSHRQRNQSN
jgi:hypothetical protein